MNNKNNNMKNKNIIIKRKKIKILIKNSKKDESICIGFR